MPCWPHTEPSNTHARTPDPLTRPVRRGGRLVDDEVAAAGQPGCLVQTPPITPAQPPRKHDIGCSGRQELLRDPRISEALRVASRATKEPRAIAGRSGAPCSLSKLRARGLPHFSLPSPRLPSPVVPSQGSRTSEFFPHPSTALHGGAGSPPPPYVQHIPYSAGPRGGSAHSQLAAQCPEGRRAGTRGQQRYGCLDPHSPRTSTGNQTEAVSVPFGGKFPP